MSVELPKLTLGEKISISQNPNLETLDLGSLKTLTGTFSTAIVAKLETVSLSNLENAKSVSVSGSAALSTLDVGKLTTCEGLTIGSAIVFASLNISSLKEFSRMDVNSRGGGASTAVLDNVFSILTAIDPVITDKTVLVKGTISDQALMDIETLRGNGNTVTIN